MTRPYLLPLSLSALLVVISLLPASPAQGQNGSLPAGAVCSGLNAGTAALLPSTLAGGAQPSAEREAESRRAQWRREATARGQSAIGETARRPRRDRQGRRDAFERSWGDRRRSAMRSDGAAARWSSVRETEADVLGAASPTVAPADCEWTPGFGFGGLNGPVFAQTTFDDGSGSGPALFVGGDFFLAGGIFVNGIAKWDGSTWSALGAGMDDVVFALAVFDDGGGPDLYAGGFFTTAGGLPASGIARWDGTSWSPVGSGVDDSVFALAVFDDGGGDALFAGGFFSIAGGTSADNIAEWDGTSWSALGLGVGDEVDALTVFDDGLGGGPKLYAGGFFGLAGGAPADFIASWDGASWSPLGLGTDAPVFALATFDDGGGDALYAGGFFADAGGVTVFGVAEWDGAAWSDLDGGMDFPVLSLRVFDDGGGPQLFAGGFFTIAGSVSASGVASWDGMAWSSLGSGVVVDFFFLGLGVDSLGVFDDGGGAKLFAGGVFFQAGGSPADFLAAWDGMAWSSVLSTGPGFLGMNEVVFALQVFDDGLGGGPALYAGGAFSTAGGVPASAIAKWDGTAWSPLGSGLECLPVFLPPPVPPTSGAVDSASAGGIVFPGCTFPVVEALAVYDDGSGPALYAGGIFDLAGGMPAANIAKWDGMTWSPLGLGTDDIVEALAVFDDGGGEDLYVGGEFDSVDGFLLADNIARWDGTTWSAVGDANGDVETLATFDDGGGTDLYAGGEFTTIGGVPASRIASFDGTTWSPLGLGTDDEVETLFVFDDGGGPDLYAGGQFDFAGGITVNSIARWDGSAWSDVGGGMAAPGFRTVDALAAYDDGNGPRLHAGGFFDTAGGVAAVNIARWDGTSWSPLGLGTEEEVEALAVFDDGGGASLWAGGFFIEAGGLPSSFIAEWSCPLLDFGDAPDPTYPTFLASDGARHDVLANFHLGAGVDPELEGQPDAGATGDDLDLAGDDEDGVAFLGPLMPGAATDVDVTASAAGTLDAWIDWNGDGDWDDAGEKVFDGVALAMGTNNLMLTAPATAVVGGNFARFRFSSAGIALPDGRASDGEVEDYAVTVEPVATTVTVTDLMVTFSEIDQLVALSANVTDSIPVDQGTVTFTVFDGVVPVGIAVVSPPLTNGAAAVTYTLPAYTPSGSYTIEASYSGGPDFDPSVGFGVLTVLPILPGDDDGDGVDNVTEDGAPNGGDANLDGIPDRLQSDVTSFPSTGGEYITLTTKTPPVGPVTVTAGSLSAGIGRVDSGAILGGGCQQRNVVAIDRATLPPDNEVDRSYVQVTSPVAFELECPAATVTLLYFGITDLSNAVYRKFGRTAADPTPHWYGLPAIFATTMIGAETVATATFSLVDGGLGDDDLIVNDRIVDPSGPAFVVPFIPTLSAWAMLMLVALLGGAALLALRAR